ncbi:MAG: phosphomethylpyrimidine synthase ThiC [Ignisphaera sp.]|nr:phosphomethylpyrimidine synthase ThiC [Ignisphaera sp.]MCX8168212.1 phosphomethylpyrimidine synthase ThiC [Ignisphaera sp.]MDW8084918.1 phosphomethylpyrimidine synthase ThiC [Ignisphaera sp.]
MPIKNIDDAILKDISVEEGVEVEFLKRGIMHGRIILPMNVKRNRVKPIAIGEGLRTKVNVNIGTSGSVSDIDMEVEKARVAAIYGADTVMDLSTGGNIDEIRRSLIEASRPLPFGTVPVYQAWIEGVKKYGSAGIPSDWFISTVEQHLRDGVDFMTIHAGISKELAKKAIKSMRIMPIVSRGGSMIAVWMLENNEENPYLQHWDYLIELFKEYNAVISLGDALRPGTVVDAFDALQIEELVNNAKLARDAVSKGVQVMIEGPGHMTLEKIAADVKLMKSLSGRVPYYVLGPLVTDIAVGYDHIAAAIGAAVAAANGADIICYLTPSEHLSLPNVEQVKEGLIAAKIAAHAGDLIKLGERAVKRDIDMSLARARLDWNTQIALSFDREKARSIKTQFGETERSCSMCGQYCVFILLEKYLGKREGVKLDDILARVLKGVTL